MALQMDGVAEIVPSRELNNSSTRSGRGFDGFVDGWSVQSLAIAGSAEGSHVESAAGCSVSLRRCWCRPNRGSCSQRGAGDPGSRELEEIPSL